MLYDGRQSAFLRENHGEPAAFVSCAYGMFIYSRQSVKRATEKGGHLDLANMLRKNRSCRKVGFIV